MKLTKAQRRIIRTLQDMPGIQAGDVLGPINLFPRHDNQATANRRTFASLADTGLIERADERYYVFRLMPELFNKEHTS